METYQNYRGYGIRYYEIVGLTVIEKYGVEIHRYEGLGEIRGLESAKVYIDKLHSNSTDGN